jgi:hypothetical protein
MSTIYEKLEQAKQLRIARSQATKELYEQIMQLEKQMEAISAPFEEAYEAIEEEVRQEVLSIEKPFKSDIADISYRKGYIRSSWDSKALTGFAAAHPEIEQFKKETFVEPSVSINWKL